MCVLGAFAGQVFNAICSSNFPSYEYKQHDQSQVPALGVGYGFSRVIVQGSPLTPGIRPVCPVSRRFCGLSGFFLVFVYVVVVVVMPPYALYHATKSGHTMTNAQGIIGGSVKSHVS